jgi:Glycosyl transferase 4-like domain
MASAARDLTETSSGLPRIAVISDVGVERTGAGALLLHRLLNGYPSERLRIFCNPVHASSTPGVRLSGISYQNIDYRFSRLLQTRFNPLGPVAAAYQMQLYARLVRQSLADFRPQALISVANGYLWFTADAVAKQLGIPLHLFLHEDWPQLITLHRRGALRRLVMAAARQLIKPIFARPGARFSVSPGMADELRARYGLESEVFYPNRGEDSPEPVVRVQDDGSRPPTVAHAGFIHLAGNADLLRSVAALLEPLGGHLDLYTQHSEAELAGFGLVGPAVRRIGYFPAREFAERVAATAHALFLTASFDEKDRTHERTLFPSKLADYTGIGLPIFIWGPRYSSAARWAAENPGAALIFTDRDEKPVADAIARISRDAGYARTLAGGAVDIGKRFFELSTAREQLYRALRKTY